MIEFAVTFSPGADLDVNMGQVMEVLATEERTVELSMLFFFKQKTAYEIS